MEKPLKLKRHMARLHAITVFTRKEGKPVQIALLQSLLGHGDLHTGIGSASFFPFNEFIFIIGFSRTSSFSFIYIRALFLGGCGVELVWNGLSLPHLFLERMSRVANMLLALLEEG